MASPHPQPGALLSEAREQWATDPGLPPVPDGLVATRIALHSVAESVVSAARLAATGNEIALRWHPGGFGTPPFDDDRGARIVRVEGTELVDSCDGSERRAALTTLRDTASLVGDVVETHELPAEPLAIDPAAAAFLGRWFCFATLVIAELQTSATADLEPGMVHLWPEHFDVATELGSEEGGARAAYGASPGDEDHAEPYLYVAPWSARPEGELWSATAFAGAELSYAELLESPDPVGRAREFFTTRLGALIA